MKREDVYAKVAQNVIEALENGHNPWHCPFERGASGMPRNAITGKPYRGINRLVLNAAVTGHAPFYATYNAAKKAGYPVLKGSKGFPVVFWKVYNRETEDETETERTGVIARYYTVFSTDQLENGQELAAKFQTEQTEIEPIETAEKLWNSWFGAPRINWGSGRAAYAPKLDIILMPEKAEFDNAESLYQTLFHEGIHATGHESRLNRLEKGASFGNDKYAKEELVAEIGSGFLSDLTGIPHTENNVAYLASWAKRIKADYNLLISACSQAQKAYDMITANFPEKKD